MQPTPPKPPVTILVVEDDEVDLIAIQRSFRHSKLANEIVVARDGLEALRILRQEPGAHALAKPYIILLDLNMPRMNGFEFLQAVRLDPVLQPSIIFVLTTSKSDEDRARAYAANVAGFIVKNDAGRSFLSAVEMLDHFWKVVELP